MTPDSPDISRDILMAAENMPAISPIMGKINEISREMDTSPRDMVKIIMLDPVLTGKVIKLVNSSFYGLPHRVKSLAQAVVLLGLNTVKNLAISTALFNTLFIKTKSSPIHPEEFWRHCLGTAVGCKSLARSLRMSPDLLETFFVAGLLHDVGKILLIRTNTKRYEMALDESHRLGVSLAFAELAHFGCSHSQAGGILARKWKLEDFLTEVIELHHSPPNNGISSFLEVVTVVNNMCKLSLIGESGNCVFEEIAEDSSDRLRITPKLFRETANQLPAELEKAAEFLNLVEDQNIQ